MDSYPVLLAAVPAEIETELAAAIGDPRSIRSFPDARPALPSLQKAVPLVAVVAVGDPAASDAIDLVRAVVRAGARAVVLGTRKDPELILAAMRAGAREYLVRGEEPGVVATVQQILESSGGLRLAALTAVLGAKGGLGATVLAAHLAGALHRAGSRVCLADLDLELGDVLTLLDLPGSYALSDVAANAKRLDRDLLDASIPRHRSGVWVLGESERVGAADRLGAEGVARVLRFLRHHYDHVVLDGLRGFGDVALAGLDVASRIVLVVTQEVPAVRSAQRCAGLLRQLGYDGERLFLVVNRYQRGSPISRQVIEETVRLPIRAVVGNDFAALSRATNRGVLLFDEAPRSVVARDVAALAKELAGGGAARPEPLLKKLFWPKAVFHGAQ